VRSHSKAPLAGSTPSQASAPGRICCGAVATRGVSLTFSGSGAPAVRRLTLLRVLVTVTVTALATVVLAATANAAVVKDTWAEDVVFTEAIVKATINPEGASTTYHFEYGTTEAYGLQSPELPVGSDSTDHTITRFLDGLQPGTTYHYRAVATNGVVGPDRIFTTYMPPVPDAACPNQTFRIGVSSNLPDCRAYEMVSPLDKNGGQILTFTRIAYEQASLDGSKVTYTSTTSFGDEPSNREANQYLSSRSADGWSTNGISAPLGEQLNRGDLAWRGTTILGFSDDLSYTWIKDNNVDPLTPDAVQGLANFYRRDNLTGTYHDPFFTSPPLAFDDTSGYFADFGHSQGGERFHLAGHTDDNSHVLVDVRAKLTPEAEPGSGGTMHYQVYDKTVDELRLVNILPNDQPYPGNAYVGTFPEAAGGFGANSQWEGYGMSNERAISDDGSRIFWSAHKNEYTGGPLYVRIDGQTTIPVSGAVTTDNAWFLTASTDGSKAVFKVTSGPLTGSLYEFDVDTESATLISTYEGTESPDDDPGVVGASQDLSYLYFTSREALDPEATLGQPNLYLRRDGVNTFIATLAPTDSRPAGRIPEGSAIVDGRMTIDFISPSHRSSRVTADGRHLAFMSSANLTGYDNSDVKTGEAVLEVYRYDADTNQLICVSCSPSGARPAGMNMWFPYFPSVPVTDIPLFPDGSPFPSPRAAAWIPPWGHEHYAARALSPDGNRVFFNSFDALVPQDTNGVQDVYQWEAQGSGKCAAADGCIRLISTGKSPLFSEFVDTSQSGDDIFFRTASGIDPRDPGSMDLYDARVNGGFPLPTGKAECQGETCQTPPDAPNDPTPASSAFEGAGNVKEAPHKRCPKGKRRVRRNGKIRCLGRHRRADKDRRAAR
jgi:hypothetical protein